MGRPDPSTIRTLLLDAGGVLVRPDFERVAEARAVGLRVVLLDEAGLYPDADGPRVGSLGELAGHLVSSARPGQDFLLDSGTAR